MLVQKGRTLNKTIKNCGERFMPVRNVRVLLSETMNSIVELISAKIEVGFDKLMAESVVLKRLMLDMPQSMQWDMVDQYRICPCYIMGVIS
ncbi:hypothetical protein PVK06_020357 [Gossypium arboreum]|uniref:Uncharacterized protein n=1 Tax=Gossypium arboreum TaxID=29729 RepID=A0ABR0PM53_GOSAR|nr:hypothetical protein PVK06_020357 [Gossypium arboreum]